MFIVHSLSLFHVEMLIICDKQLNKVGVLGGHVIRKTVATRFAREPSDVTRAAQ